MLNPLDVRSIKVDKEFECFVCDKTIKGPMGIEIEIHLPWPLGSKRFHLHEKCELTLRDLLEQRHIEASKGIVTVVK